MHGHALRARNARARDDMSRPTCARRVARVGLAIALAIVLVVAMIVSIVALMQLHWSTTTTTTTTLILLARDSWWQWQSFHDHVSHSSKLVFASRRIIDTSSLQHHRSAAHDTDLATHRLIAAHHPSSHTFHTTSFAVDKHSTGAATTDIPTTTTHTSFEASRTLLLAQFDDPAALRALTTVGSSNTLAQTLSASLNCTVGPYFPHNALVLFAPLDVVDQLYAQTRAAWIGVFPIGEKMESSVRAILAWADLHADALDTTLTPTRIAWSVSLAPIQHDPATAPGIAQEWTDRWTSLGIDLRATAITSLQHDKILVTSSATLTTRVAASELAMMVAHPACYYVQPVEQFDTQNEYAQVAIQSGAFGAAFTMDGVDTGAGRTVWQRGLRGESQIVACADSGLDVDHCFFAERASASSPRARSKIVAYQPLPGADSQDYANGHGTHVVGTLVGDPLDELLPSDALSPGTASSLRQHTGMAPKARVVFQDVGAGKSLSTLSSIDVAASLLDPARQAGAFVHSNSWGSATNSYTETSRSIDSYLWSHPDMLVVVAAGNDGLKRGQVQGTVGSPATSKNAIAVGASQTSSGGWVANIPYLSFADRSAEAAASLGTSSSSSSFDCCSSTSYSVLFYCCEFYTRSVVQQHANRYNEESVAAFSSRGPVFDGRLKPDVVASGQLVVSARSDGVASTSTTVAAGNAQQCSSTSNALLALEGTSMATPVVSGAALLVRQYLVEGWYPYGAFNSTPNALAKLTQAGSSNASASAGAGAVLRATSVAAQQATMRALVSAPSGALLGALLANSARSLTGLVDVNNDGTTLKRLDSGDGGGISPPSIYQGYGKVQIDRVLYFADAGVSNGSSSTAATAASLDVKFTDRRLWISDGQTIAEGRDHDYCFFVAGSSTVNATTTIKVTLRWHDYPAQPAAAFSTVNDLDVYVGRVDADTLAGNFLTQRDAMNNMEQVVFDGARAGDWFHVKVRGVRVPYAQRYAVVATGPLDPLRVEGPFDVPAYDTAVDGDGTRTTRPCAFDAQGQTRYQIASDRFATANPTSDEFPYAIVIGSIGGGVVLFIIVAVLVWRWMEKHDIC